MHPHEYVYITVFLCEWVKEKYILSALHSQEKVLKKGRI